MVTDRQQITDWQHFYSKFLKIRVDFSNIRIPENRDGFDRLIVVAQGLTPNRVVDICRKHFRCRRYIRDLDEATKGCNDREPTEHYAIRVRDRVEPDEELQNLSVDDLKKRGIQGITLLECLLLELKYWLETDGEHLGVHNIPLCAGSRDSDGRVPSICWNNGGILIGLRNSEEAHLTLRARAVIS